MENSGDRSREEEWKAGEDRDTAGMGRSYECVFCKRGFTTAQALGGHMNIHRKDRAKTSTTKPGTSSARAGHVATTTTTTHAQNDVVYHKPSCSPVGEGYGHHKLHGCSFPATGTRAPADCGWSLSLQVGPARVDDDRDEDRRRGEELDLELRLGHGRP